MTISEARHHVYNDSAKIVYEHYVNVMGVKPDKDGIIDITVTVDGSWKTRGFTSNMGHGSIIDANTGYLLDNQNFSKNCKLCKTYKNKIKNKKLGKEAYDTWYKKHLDSGKCKKKFNESSGMMEVRAAEYMFKRSLENEKYKMRYKYVVCDGDCKTILHLNNTVQPYGKKL